jgi:hypothetical protein
VIETTNRGYYLATLGLIGLAVLAAYFLPQSGMHAAQVMQITLMILGFAMVQGTAEKGRAENVALKAEVEQLRDSAKLMLIQLNGERGESLKALATAMDKLAQLDPSDVNHQLAKWAREKWQAYEQRQQAVEQQRQATIIESQMKAATLRG